MSADPLIELRDRLREFTREREWGPLSHAEEPGDGADRRRRPNWPSTSSGSPPRKVSRRRTASAENPAMSWPTC
ncbi:MAG: hypothetical protein M5R42_04695 [Rhodocyclaceae bacterium]|nr:hypothetical protein [Rhodocyclaceae bacterium]